MIKDGTAIFDATFYLYYYPRSSLLSSTFDPLSRSAPAPEQRRCKRPPISRPCSRRNVSDHRETRPRRPERVRIFRPKPPIPPYPTRRPDTLSPPVDAESRPFVIRAAVPTDRAPTPVDNPAEVS